MDTYFHTNGNCVRCGRCVVACHEHGKDFLYGGRDIGPREKYDYVPCHHCNGRFSKIPPCQEVCYYNAIEITRG